ncbi:MAG: hypothetical protein WC488_02985 [Candidatus Micrarchaeia archaeon]
MGKGETSLKVRKQAEQEPPPHFIRPVPRASGPKAKAAPAQEERKLEAGREAAIQIANELNRLAHLKTRYS